MFNIYFIILFFCLLLHRLAVSIRLPFHDFLQVIIVLIQVYNWEIRHHSLVCGCGLVDILCFTPLLGTEEDLPQNDQEPVVKSPLKPNPGLAPNVVSDLKQLDDGPQGVKAPADAAGENLNIGRLGMGGLKALEKINNLIKASAETQDGEEGPSDNGLTDEQAQAIERMIIEGIHHIKKNTPEGSGTQRASIPRQKITPNVISKAFPKFPQAARPKGVPVQNQSKSTTAQKKDSKPVAALVQVGTPRLQKEEPKLKGVSQSNKVDSKSTVGSGKMRPIPVLKSKFTEQRKNSEPRKLRGLGLGIAGTGNSP